MAAEHLVLHLHAIPAIEELVAARRPRPARRRGADGGRRRRGARRPWRSSGAGGGAAHGVNHNTSTTRRSCQENSSSHEPAVTANHGCEYLEPGAGRHHGMGRNDHDIRDEIPVTARAPSATHRGHGLATRSASASRSSTRKRDRPPPTLRYGSAGTTSVHPRGTEQRTPSGCSKVTRSSPQSCLATTNRNAWPRSGWNGWMIRICVDQRHPL